MNTTSVACPGAPFWMMIVSDERRDGEVRRIALRKGRADRGERAPRAVTLTVEIDHDIVVGPRRARRRLIVARVPPPSSLSPSFAVCQSPVLSRLLLK
jgi:hypothetical protein